MIQKQRGDHYRKLLKASADAIIRREGSALVKQADKNPQELREWAHKWFKEHAHYVADVMAVDERRAKAYSEDRRLKLMATVADGALTQYLTDMTAAGAKL